MQDTHGDEARPRSLIRALSPAVAGILPGSVFFLLAAVGLVLLASDALRRQERESSEQLRAVAASAAALVEPLAHERLERPEDTGNPDYGRAIGALVRFHDTQPSIEWMCTMRVHEGRLYYVLDTALYRAGRSALLVRIGIALVACLLLAIALGMQEARRRMGSTVVTAP